MRAHRLRSPHRGRHGQPTVHDGTVVTQAPNVMWGTDGVRVCTLDDGGVWTVAAVEHGNAAGVGWHVCTVRTAVAAVVERYHTAWRLEKIGYHTPIEAREPHALRQAA